MRYSPVEVAVKTLYKGQVGIRDKYVKEAHLSGKDIIIKHNRSAMRILHNEIKSRMAGQSERPFVDKFDSKPHYLCYYKWEPDVEQLSLIEG